tara:strand:+ start:146 stop:1273 length:1128 start_codon:yes stop_codon:yes gene_type:complete
MAILQLPEAGSWFGHVMLSCVAVATISLSSQYSIGSRKPGLMLLIFGVCIIYVFGFIIQKKIPQYFMAIISCIFCLLPLLIGVLCWFFATRLNFDDTLFFSGVIVALIFPLFALYMIVKSIVEDILGKNKTSSKLISTFSFACCGMFLLPFGIVLPFFVSLDIYNDVIYARLFLTAIGTLAILYVINIAFGAALANKQVSNMEKEKFFKQCVKKISTSLRKINVHCHEDVGRLVAEYVYDTPDDSLKKAVMECPLFVIFSHTHHDQIKDPHTFGIKTVLCSNCKEKNLYAKALPWKRFCKPCAMERIFKKNIERLNMKEEEKYANAERKAQLEIQKQHEQEVERRKRMQERKKSIELNKLMKRKKVSFILNAYHQ